MIKRPINGPGIAARIVRDSAAPPPRPSDDDTPEFARELDAYAAKFKRSARVMVGIPTIDDEAMMRSLKRAKEVFGSLHERAAAIHNRSYRRDEVEYVLRRLSREFAYLCGVNSAPKKRNRRKRANGHLTQQE